MRESMAAVTIGIGELYSELAEIAAQRMRKYTGLPVHILNEQNLSENALSAPECLKFRLFDLLDADTLLFFDADVFCLRKWNPREFQNLPEWVGVRSFWFDPWIRKFGSVYGFGDDLCNGGFFICNRRHHEQVLSLAEHIQRADCRYHGLSSTDEVSIGSALQILGIERKFLDRRFNWIQYGKGNLQTSAGIINAHACDQVLRDCFRCTTMATLPLTSRDVDIESEFSDATYIYDRVGYDVRPLHFRADGTIDAKTGGDAERYFMAFHTNDGSRLVIGSVHDETARFSRDANGIWRGQWLHHERMPVTLERHRAQVLSDAITSRFDKSRPLTGVEVGVHLGETAEILLRAFPQLYLFLVDPWNESDGYSAQSRALFGLNSSQAAFDSAMLLAAKSTSFAEFRRTLVRCDSCAAARFLPDNLDFVFIDGDHRRELVEADINAWWPKLSTQGFLAGHDYDNPRYPGVLEAVDGFAKQHNLRVQQGSDKTWFITRDGTDLRVGFSPSADSKDWIASSGYWIGSPPGGYFFDERLAISLATEFRGSSVVDFGCGSGSYVSYLRQQGVACVGYDGNPATAESNNQWCHVLDLAEPANLGRKFDWVLSLEVGEHIPRAFESVFVDNLVRHCRHGMIISWAQPGQGGRGHVNEQPNAYVRKLFRSYGFLTDKECEARLRECCDLDWFPHTLMVFRRTSQHPSRTHL